MDKVPLSPQWRRALEMLAAAGESGSAEATLMARGFPAEMLKSLVCVGLATPSMDLVRAFGEKVESMIVDSHDGANRIQDPHWCKGASHEWGSLIPTICANVSLRQSKPVIPV
jgi:hypothetical protein